MPLGVVFGKMPGRVVLLFGGVKKRKPLGNAVSWKTITHLNPVWRWRPHEQEGLMGNLTQSCSDCVRPGVDVQMAQERAVWRPVVSGESSICPVIFFIKYLLYITHCDTRMVMFLLRNLHSLGEIEARDK